MSDGLSISEISLLNDLKQLKAISHNLANVNTPGYKQQLIGLQGFDAVIDAAKTERFGRAGEQFMSAQKPYVSTTIDTHSGAMKFTGDPLDVALADNVYFSVQTQHGEAYTRQGDFQLDARGRLVTNSGLPVLGQSGEIRLTTDKPVINQQGQIYIQDQPVDQFKLFRMQGDGKLSSLGGALYQSAGVKQLLSNENVLHQGYVEASNVNMTDQMVKMIEITRHFESSQRVIRGYDQMLDNAINIIGDMQN